MEQWIVGGMVIIGIAFMVASCFVYSMEHEDKDKALELIEGAGYITVFITVMMFFSLMVV